MTRTLFAMLLFALLCLGCQKKSALPALPQADGPVTVSVSLDNPKVRVGDIAKYQIKVVSAPGVDVMMPEFGASLANRGDLLIHDWNNAEPRLLPSGRTERIQNYELETYLTGVYEIPPVGVLYCKDGETNQVVSSSVCLEIVSLSKEGDMEDVREVKDVMEFILKDGGKGRLIALLAALAAIAATALAFFRRKKKEEPIIVIPAHEKAIAALRELKETGLLEAGRIEEYLARLCLILRTYIEDRFGIRAPEQTTEEFLAVLRQSPEFTYQQRESIRHFLEECDMVKFANQKGSLELAEEATSGLEQFIAATMEKPKETEEGQAPKEGDSK